MDLNDLASLLAAYGACTADLDCNPAADFDDDDECITLPDLAVLLTNYGS